MPKVEWEYCECGCHGSRTVVGGEPFKRRTYGKGIMLIGGEFGPGPYCGTEFESREAADGAVIKSMRKRYEELKVFFEGDDGKG